MYQHEYDRSHDPAMPIAEIKVKGMGQEEIITAMIDSGADATFLPERLLKNLGLRPARKINVSGIGGFSYRADAYLVSLSIGEYDVYGIYVIGDKQNRAILGRDVLNNLVVTLNGLALSITISD